MLKPGGIQITAIPVRRIWTRMAAGAMSPTTAMFGFRTSQRAGFRIAMAIGRMSLITAGLGWATSRGAGLLITMAGGFGTAIRGHGGRDRSGQVTTRSGHRPTFPSGVGAVVSALDSAGAVGVVSDGSRSARVTGSIRGGGDTAAALDGLDTAGMEAVTEDSDRCMEERDSLTS